MLEKNAKKDKNFLFDAHFHYAVCMKKGISMPDFGKGIKWGGISCAHSKDEFELQKQAPKNIVQSYGLHPQNAVNENIKGSADFLEKLLYENQIAFIGEAGFDYFTQEFRDASNIQEEIFNIQLDLASHYNVSLVIHCRKANQKLFEYSRQLAKLPEVLFHSFMGPPVEAQSLLERGINGYFSFGKQLLNGNKKAIACVRELPEERILAETDAPFQYLKDEQFTAPEDIKRIYEEINILLHKN